MASGFVRSCIHAVMEKCPPGYERSVKLQETAEKLLTMAVEKEESFHLFCIDIVSYNYEERDNCCLSKA